MNIGYLLQAGVPEIRRAPFSGPANHVREVCVELGRRGHRVRLLALLDERIWMSSDLQCFEPVVIDGLDRGPLRWLERVTRRLQYELRLPYAALFESVRFAAACRQALSDCDLFYERMGWVGYGGAVASRCGHIPLVLEINGDHPTEFAALGAAPRGAQRRLSMALMRFAVRSAAHLVATGEGWRRSCIERWRVRGERVTTIENGSRLVELCARDALPCFRPPGEPGELVTVVFAGSFEPWQGIDILLRAFAGARARGTAVRLEVIGSGSEEQRLRRLTQELHVGETVTFTGPLDLARLAERLTMGAIGVSPYAGRVEFSGLKLLDYKAAGLAIIASGRDGQPALIEHGRTGWVVPPGDACALADAIAHLSRDAALRQRLGRQARLEAEAHHGWQHTARRLEDVFGSVLARAHHRP